MKKNKEQQQAIIDGLRLIEDLLIPQVTPRVPSHIRDRARDVIRRYPSETELRNLIENTDMKHTKETK